MKAFFSSLAKYMIGAQSVVPLSFEKTDEAGSAKGKTLGALPHFPAGDMSLSRGVGTESPRSCSFG